MYTPEDIKKNYIRKIYEDENNRAAFTMIDRALDNYGSINNVFTIVLPRQIDTKALVEILYVYKYLGGWEDITGEVVNGLQGFPVTRLTFTAYGQTNSI